MTCYTNCLHCDVCKCADEVEYKDFETMKADCPHFKNKADFVEVVRCRDCKHWRTEHCGFCEASNALCEVNNANTDFCSYGERKDT